MAICCPDSVPSGTPAPLRDEDHRRGAAICGPATRHCDPPVRAPQLAFEFAHKYASAVGATIAFAVRLIFGARAPWRPSGTSRRRGASRRRTSRRFRGPVGIGSAFTAGQESARAALPRWHRKTPAAWCRSAGLCSRPRIRLSDMSDSRYSVAGQVDLARPRRRLCTADLAVPRSSRQSWRRRFGCRSCSERAFASNLGSL
jgi:hypothetical protein